MPRQEARRLARSLLKTAPNYTAFAELEDAPGEGEESEPDQQL